LLDEHFVGNIEDDVDQLLHLPVDLLIVPLVLELRELVQFFYLVFDVMVHLPDLELEFECLLFLVVFLDDLLLVHVLAFS
jgi:hypothetical protein